MLQSEYFEIECERKNNNGQYTEAVNRKKYQCEVRFKTTKGENDRSHFVV